MSEPTATLHAEQAPPPLAIAADGPSLQPLPTPAELRRRFPLSAAARQSVNTARVTLKRILSREDPRLFVVTGPCSVHDVEATREYAERLAALTPKIHDAVVPVMRVYCEKPRTTVGWKGFLTDPHLDGSNDLAAGLALSRKLMTEVAELGLPVATELLHPLAAPYLHDLIGWVAIGARTTESQTHREMASGLPTVVGFKNGTDGHLEVALNAMLSAAAPHAFPGIDDDGRPALLESAGNPHLHIVLRGGRSGPNYSAEHVAACEAGLHAAGLPAAIMVDASHANSGKDHRNQPKVIDAVARQIEAGNRSIVGLMVESFLHEGRQSLGGDHGTLAYGVSVTDACIGWEETETALTDLAGRLRGGS
ncbi:3-deoxy-7-phosphoheptulonate synthase [Endothiovibrio diazotrophicus]